MNVSGSSPILVYVIFSEKSSDFLKIMIHCIVGATGAGKTGLNACLLKKEYRTVGHKLLIDTQQRIKALNLERKKPLTIPDKPPIFSDFKTSFLDGYEHYYEPYYINGYYFGMVNEKMPTQFVLPNSRIHLSEVQRYYNSKDGTPLPRHVSNLFEMHRHYGLDIWMDVQRGMLVDKNIRDLCRHFIEVQDMEHIKTETGRIIQTTWHCREFDSNLAFEEYLETGKKTYFETTYVYRGNIFRIYDSFEHFDDFIPGEGKDFTCLPFLKKGEKVPPEFEMYYRIGEPKEYRHVPKPPASKEKRVA